MPRSCPSTLDVQRQPGRAAQSWGCSGTIRCDLKSKFSEGCVHWAMSSLPEKPLGKSWPTGRERVPHLGRLGTHVTSRGCTPAEATRCSRRYADYPRSLIIRPARPAQQVHRPYFTRICAPRAACRHQAQPACGKALSGRWDWSRCAYRLYGPVALRRNLGSPLWPAAWGSPQVPRNWRGTGRLSARAHRD
jgi:hypothetical protein